MYDRDTSSNVVSTGIFNKLCSFLEYETYLEKLIKLSRKSYRVHARFHICQKQLIELKIDRKIIMKYSFTT